MQRYIMPFEGKAMTLSNIWYIKGQIQVVETVAESILDIANATNDQYCFLYSRMHK